MTTIMTVGTFDILHVDHLRLFRQCRKIVGPEGRVLVGVNTDSFVEEYKGHHPVMSQDDRSALVYAIKGIDEVFQNDDTSLDWCIEKYQPDFLAIGSDWFAPGKDYMAQIAMTWKQMLLADCMVVIVPSFERVHSSDFRHGSVGEPILIGQKVVSTDEG